MQVDWTFEELGSNEGKALDVTITVDIQPEEPRTYDYPGYPATVEVTEVEVTGWDNESIVGHKWANGWEEYVEKIAFALAEENINDIMEHQ